MRYLKRNWLWVAGAVVLYLVWKNRGVTAAVPSTGAVTPGPVEVNVGTPGGFDPGMSILYPGARPRPDYVTQ